MPRKKYLEIKEKIDYIDQHDFHEEGIIKIADKLEKILEKYPNHSEIKLACDCGYEGCYGYEVWGTRLETDKERNRRLEKDRKIKERKQQQKKEKRKKLIAEAKKLGIRAEDLK